MTRSVEAVLRLHRNQRVDCSVTGSLQGSAGNPGGSGPPAGTVSNALLLDRMTALAHKAINSPSKASLVPPHGHILTIRIRYGEEPGTGQFGRRVVVAAGGLYERLRYLFRHITTG